MFCQPSLHYQKVIDCIMYDELQSYFNDDNLVDKMYIETVLKILLVYCYAIV